MATGAGLVDLSLWNTDRAALVAQVGAAARDTGFLQVLRRCVSCTHAGARAAQS